MGKDYSFLASLRPFSFVVALLACGLGWVLAAQQSRVAVEHGVLILLGGLLLQAGVNLINDYADLSLIGLDVVRRRRIRRNFAAGLGCFLAAAGVGVYFAALVGFPFLLLCIVGLVGALGYTLQPINYKAKGLGVVLVFWLMGVLMVSGSYTALTGLFEWRVVIMSLPVSCLVAALLLSNELRDYEADRADQIATLTVRRGFAFGRRLFLVMVALCYLLTLLNSMIFALPLLAVTLLSVPFVRPLLVQAQLDKPREKLPPLCGRLLLCFGTLYLLALGLG